MADWMELQQISISIVEVFFYINRLSVKLGFDKVVALINELERKEGLFGVADKLKEDAVARPQGEGVKLLLFYPFEVSLVAILQLFALPLATGEEMHILAGPDVGNERDYATVLPLGDIEPGLFLDLAEHALVGTFILLTLASDAYPLVVRSIVLFLDTMEHKVSAVELKIAKGGLLHNFLSRQRRSKPRLYSYF